MEAKRDGLDLMVAIFDHPGERRPFNAGRIGKRDDCALRGERRDRERQVFDRLAPDVEDMRAGGLTLEIFLGNALVDLPRQERGLDLVSIQNPDHEEVRRTNGSTLNGIERERKIPGASCGEYDVSDSQKGMRTFGGQRDSLHFEPIDTSFSIDVAHLNNGDVTTGQFIHCAAKRVSRRDDSDRA